MLGYMKWSKSLTKSLGLLGKPILCDDNEEPARPTLLEEADKIAEEKRVKFRPPQQFEVLKQQMSPSAHQGAFDGFRVLVAGPMNMNSQVMHTFMLGSSAMQGQPYYNYRGIYGDEYNTIQVSTDLDFNGDGYLRTAFTDTTAGIVKWQAGDQGKHADFSIQGSDQVSSWNITMLPLKKEAELAFLQQLTPGFAYGMAWNLNWDKLDGTFQGAMIYEDDDNMVAGCYEENNIAVVYKRRVNPNRVHLASEFKYDLSGQKESFSLSAEFMLKQAKLHMTVDRNLAVATVIESNVRPGLKLMFSATLDHASDGFNCGYGLQFGD